MNVMKSCETLTPPSFGASTSLGVLAWLTTCEVFTIENYLLRLYKFLSAIDCCFLCTIFLACFFS